MRTFWLEREYHCIVKLIQVAMETNTKLLCSIEGVVDQWEINETFVGVILLPIVGK